MLLDTFKKRIKLFADNPDDLIVKDGKVLIQVHDEIIEAGITLKDGNVFIDENGLLESAEKWISKRIAKLPLLANRILSYLPEEEYFVSPSCSFLDDLRVKPDEQLSYCEKTEEEVLDFLNRPSFAETSVLNLTSDAGEGKTTLINRMAREQAHLYQKNETDWLILPVSLGGKPFMRIDDVIIGGLVNKLRFPYLYYESVIELAKLGYLVLALDGFEEMFIETPTGEAISALGNLLQRYDSCGKVVVAARKAYFEFKSLKTQSQLFDSFPDCDVSFSKITINRWGEEQFCDYGKKRGVHESKEIYSQITQKFGQDDHPLITRAVLVKRLFNVIESIGDPRQVIDKIGISTKDYFKEFIDVIIEREVEEKWIDRSGDLAKPLFIKDEHYTLLANIAEEMWVSTTDSLSSPIFDMIAELTCENMKKSSGVTRQIVERIKQHSLIVSSSSARDEFQFDHEEFKWFFLGQKIAEFIEAEKDNDVRRIFRISTLPDLVIEIASLALKKDKMKISEKIKYIQLVAQYEGPGSFVKENSGSIVACLLDGTENEELEVGNMIFHSNILKSKTIKNVKFVNCIFQNSNTYNTNLENCKFVSCDINNIEIEKSATFSDVVFVDTVPISLYIIEEDEQLFDPSAMKVTLEKLGCKLQDAELEADVEPKGLDEERMGMLKRASRLFYRTSYVNEDTFKVKLGAESNNFFTFIMPDLLRKEILEELQYRGGGRQKRYKVKIRMSEFEKAYSGSMGNFDKFLAYFNS